MFQKQPAEKTGLEEAIDALLAEMANLTGDDEAYAQMVTQLDTLYKLKEVDHKITTGKRVSRDTWVIVGGNILAVLMIVGHERAHVVTSKALQFLMKLK